MSERPIKSALEVIDAELPTGWTRTSMDVAGKWLTGGTPSRQIREYFEGGIPWVKSGDLTDGYVVTTDETITDRGLANSAAKLLPAGTLSVALYGATIGKLGILEMSAATNQACANCVVDPAVAITKLLFYYFLQQRQALIEAGQGGAQPNLTNQIVREWPLLLPPLREQSRIVARLDELLSHVNSARDRLSRVPLILKRFRQAVLAVACSGRLTEAWRDKHTSPTESVDQQIARLRHERHRFVRDGQRSYQPVPPHPSFEAEGPEGWRTVSLDELCIRITSGSRDWKRYYRGDGPGTFIMAQNVRPLFFDTSYRLRVAPPPNDRDRERSQVKRGDILVTIVGANTGDVCRLSDSFDQYYVCQSVAMIRPVEDSLAPFLELYLNSPIHGQAQFREWIYGEGRPHLSFDQLRQTAILFPPLAEQQEIGRRVTSLFSFASTIEAHVSAVALRADKLTQSILARAFRGELVPTEAEMARREGREYEPASVLLERIRKEREAKISSNPERKQTRRKIKR